MLGSITAYVRRHHIALLALFFALGGSAFAAGNALIPRNSVGTAQLKNGAVIKSKISSKTLRQLKGNRGAQGAPGAAGPQGPQGPQGPAGAPNPNADTLNGFAANQLARATTVAAGSATNPCTGPINGLFTTATFTTMVSRSVTAPTNGVLLVIGHISNEFALAGGGTNVGVRGRLALDGAQIGKEGEESLRSGIDTCDAGKVMTLDAAVPVAAGNHTVAFQLLKSGGDGAAWVGNGSVTTLFVPFGNAGAQGGLAPTQGASSGLSNR